MEKMEDDSGDWVVIRLDEKDHIEENEQSNIETNNDAK